MNWIDLVLALVIACSIIAGFSAGFARVAVGFAAMILGILFGFWFYGVVAGYLLDYVTSRAMANLIGFFVILALVLIVGAVVGRILAKFFKWAGLSWLDRLMGGGFGLLRGFLIAAAMATVLLAFAPEPPPPSVVDSRLLPYVIDASDAMAALTPHEIKDPFYATKDKVKEMWSPHPTHKLEGVRHE